jgi:hypothetical protein
LPIAQLVPVRNGRALLAVGVVAVFALAGCTATNSASTAAVAGGSPLLPGYDFSHRVAAADARAETEKEADAISALIPKSAVVSTVTNAKLFTSSGSSYYAVLRTITLNSTLDSVSRAESIEKTLVSAGWIKHTATTDKDTGDYLAGLSSTKSSKSSWFLLVGGNKTPGKAATISIQIGSPDLPGA